MFSLPPLPGLHLPRLPLVPDPLRRIRVPKDLGTVTTADLDSEVAPEEVGMTRDGVERIWGAVENLYRSGAHPAVQLCLRRRGQIVLNRALGHARGNGPADPSDGPKVPATTDTPFVIFSASKAITAVVAHLLDERDLIHLDDRVAEYIPEYARNGKEGVTVEHVLSHRAGVPNLPSEVLDLDKADDQGFLLEVLCNARPSTRPGRLPAYHAISGGFIVAELVRRVTGKGIREVLAEELLDPLGFRWTNFGVAPADVDEVGLSYITGAPIPPPLSIMLTRALGKSVDEVVEASNDPRFLTAVIPSGNGVTNAVELSRFFELLRAGGELDGVRVLEPRTIRRALVERSYLEIDLTFGIPVRYSTGFILGGKLISLYGPDTEWAFGHLGFTNTIGWADPQREVAGALVTSGKPVVYPEIYQLWEIMRRIGAEASKTDRHPLRVPPRDTP